jgi:hypothetical protein
MLLHPNFSYAGHSQVLLEPTVRQSYCSLLQIDHLAHWCVPILIARALTTAESAQHSTKPLGGPHCPQSWDADAAPARRITPDRPHIHCLRLPAIQKHPHLAQWLSLRQHQPTTRRRNLRPKLCMLGLLSHLSDHCASCQCSFLAPPALSQRQQSHAEQSGDVSSGPSPNSTRRTRTRMSSSAPSTMLSKHSTWLQ